MKNAIKLPCITTIMTIVLAVLTTQSVMAQKFTEDQKMLMFVVKQSSGIAGAATACNMMEYASDATRIRDSMFDTSKKLNIFNSSELSHIRQLSASEFEKSLKMVKNDPSPDCDKIPRLLNKLKSRLGL